MKHDAPRDRSIENAIVEWTGLHDAANRSRFRTVTSKPREHRMRTIESDDQMASAQQCERDRGTIAASNVKNARAAWDRGRKGCRFGYACLIDALRRIPLRDQVVLTHRHRTSQRSLPVQSGAIRPQ